MNNQRRPDPDKTFVDVSPAHARGPRPQPANVIPFAIPRSDKDPLAQLRPPLPTMARVQPAPPLSGSPAPRRPTQRHVAAALPPAVHHGHPGFSNAGPPVFGNTALAIVPEPPALLPPLPANPAPWQTFAQLGLGEPAPWKIQGPLAKLVNAQTASRWLVTAYRLLGFSILTIIVVVLVGYITTTAFFYVSDSWVVPMAITPSDEKVITLEAQLSSQRDQRDRIADQLNQAERAIAAQQRFQGEFAKAIRGDLKGRRAALERMKMLASTAAGTRAAIASQNTAYAGSARKRMKAEYAAGLIDRDTMLSGKFQLAQITSSNLSLAERQAEFETRAAELESTTRSLDRILANAEDTGEIGLSYEVLQIKQTYETSRLELAKAIETRDSLATSLARQDKIVAGLEGSAYLRAVHDQATVAFVPYANLGDVKPGAPLYECKLTMVICHHVGEVREVIAGEVQFKHPHRDQNLRGQLVEVKFDADEITAGMDSHLFAGGKPFIF